MLRKIGGGGETKASQDPANKRFGIGVTTPHEMVDLIAKLEASQEMIGILKKQRYKDGIGRRVTYEVASKSGALDALRSDVGIVYTPRGRIAIAATVDDMPKVDYSDDNAGNILIADLTKTAGRRPQAGTEMSEASGTKYTRLSASADRGATCEVGRCSGSA